MRVSPPAAPRSKPLARCANPGSAPATFGISPPAILPIAGSANFPIAGKAAARNGSPTGLP
jgi:uncharacterized Zn-binding protein involved in type VI secretion